jgi:DNA-binding NarL/FixJ family response regulator
MPSVYVVEPQSIFTPEIERLVGEAGGRVVGGSVALDLDAIITAAPEFVLLDLDYTSYDVADVLDVLREEAPLVRPIVLTDRHRHGWLQLTRARGAASVVSKAASEQELVHDLRVVLDGGAVWDSRVEVA